MELSLGLTSSSPAVGKKGPSLPSPIIDLEGDNNPSQMTFGAGVDIATWKTFSQATVAQRPTLNGTMNGLTTAAFDGTDDGMTDSAIPVTDSTFLFAVQPNLTASGTLLSQRDGTDGLVWDIYVQADGQVVLLALPGSLVNSNVGSVPMGSPSIITITCPVAQNVTIYVNGVDQTQGSNVWNPPGTGASLVLGREFATGGGKRWKGETGRVQIWDSVLSTADRQAAEADALAKWVT